MNGAIEFAARLAGVPQATINEIGMAAPHIAKLLQTFKDHEDLVIETTALLKDAQPLITRAQALYAKIDPLITPALKEFNAIVPAVQDVVAFVQAQQADKAITAARDYPPDPQIS